MTKAKIFLILALNSMLLLHASSQEIESNSNRDRDFAFEIKHIDEFIERFNNDKEAFIIKYVRENYPGTKIDRSSLVANLFNRKINWDTNEVNAFVAQANDTAKPAFLYFDSDGWYAETKGKFKYKGKLIDVVILLKIQRENNGGCKWMIVSAYSDAIPPTNNLTNFLQNKDAGKFLNPMSHATNFISLSNVLNNTKSICNYLDSNFLQVSYSKAFLKALLANQLEYQFIKRITYHFLQVDGWVFTVNRFQRSSVNSGWLISTIKRATEKEKEAYKNQLIRKK